MKCNKNYDVIVVGAGPAGSAAAKAASEKGAKTILIEEHPQIGIPQHCSGVLFGTRSGIGEKILKSMDSRVVLSEVKLRRIFSPKGRILNISLENQGVFLLDRSLFDLQMAGQAAKAGANISINTKVTGLLTDGETIIGVKTHLKTLPEIFGKVVIAADGRKSLFGGISELSELSDPKVMSVSGLTWWLANVNDVELGVLELHVGPFGGVKGWIWLERCDSFTCIADFDSFDTFEKCRRGNSLLSERVRNAIPLKVSGWAIPSLVEPLPQKTKSGLILAGAAANYYPFITCIVSGQIAGGIAAEAVKEGNVTKERLSAYDNICNEMIRGNSEISFGSFAGLSEDEQEEIFDKMIGMSNINLDVLDI